MINCIEKGNGKLYLSADRATEFLQLEDKHAIAFMLECKEHGFAPYSVRIDFDAVHEIDYLKQQDELRQQNNADMVENASQKINEIFNTCYRNVVEISKNKKSNILPFRKKSDLSMF